MDFIGLFIMLQEPGLSQIVLLFVEVVLKHAVYEYCHIPPDFE